MPSETVLEYLERLDREATKEPWEFSKLPNGWMFNVVGDHDTSECICGHEADYDPLWSREPSEADAAIIPAMRTHLRALLDTAKALQLVIMDVENHAASIADKTPVTSSEVYARARIVRAALAKLGTPHA